MNLADRVRDRVCLVTGASSGIGEVLARKLGAAGAIVVLVARSKDTLEALARDIAAQGGRAHAYACDLSDSEDTQKLIDTVLAEHARVDLLVNNAGMSIRRSVAKSYDRIHDFERTLALNFLGAVRLIMGFLPTMRANKRGHIVNISSQGAQVNVPRYGAYIASKAALDAFSRIMAIETLSDNIKVTTVYMPLVQTPMMANTTIYRAFPIRTADEAADIVIDAIIRQPKRTTTTFGNLFEFAYGVAPDVVDRILHAGYQFYPESGDEKDMKPERQDASVYHRVSQFLIKRARKSVDSQRQRDRPR